MKVEAVTGARLHFGLICGLPQTGWQFGGIGLMARQPSWSFTINVSDCDHDQISAGRATTTRIHEFLRRIRQALPLPAVTIKVSKEIPFHTGFGSGTQLALALAGAAKLIANLDPWDDIPQLSQIAGRAARSAVGTVGFRSGGFLVDHGKPADPGDLRQVDRLGVPDAWRFLLVRPLDAQGLCGQPEQDYFARQLLMPRPLVQELAERVNSFLIPALQQNKFNQFAEALETYGHAVGLFYAAEQGDVFAHPAIRSLVRSLQHAGVRGAVQSSWGPGICIPAESMAEARSIAAMIPGKIADTQLDFCISEPLNCGASIRTISPEEAHTRRC